MSHVTNLVLSIGNFDADGPLGKIREVNLWFEGNSRPLVSVDDPSLPPGWYGGGKFLEVQLYIGAYNHLDLDAFIGHLRSIKWESPERVQLFIKDQYDERFRILDVFERSIDLRASGYGP